jgi:hypothetical protein
MKLYGTIVRYVTRQLFITMMWARDEWHQLEAEAAEIDGYISDEAKKLRDLGMHNGKSERAAAAFEVARQKMIELQKKRDSSRKEERR